MFSRKVFAAACSIALAFAMAVPGLAFADDGVGDAPGLAAGSLEAPAPEAPTPEAPAPETPEPELSEPEPPAISYSVYQPGSKWQRSKSDGAHAGGKSVQAVKVKLDAGGYKGKVAYKVRFKRSGWTDWKTGGAIAGKTGKSEPITGLKVKLTGNVSQAYDVIYRVRDKDAGWKRWTFDGRVASASGGVRSLWIELHEKGASKRVNEGVYYLKTAKSAGVALANPKGSAAKAGQQLISAKAKADEAQRFYVRNEGRGLASIQSVSSGLFLGEESGRVVLRADSEKPAMRWRLLFDGGFELVNASTGSVLSLAGGKARIGANAIAAPDSADAGQRWTFTPGKLVANGYYRVKSAVGTYLDVAGASYAYGANVQTWSRNSSGAQIFSIRGKSGGYYAIENAKSFLSLDVVGASSANKANVVQSKPSSKARNLWKPELDRSGKLVFRNKKSGKVLEVAGSSKKPGANVRQNAANGSAGQLWKLEKAKRYTLSGDDRLDHNVADTLRTIKDLRSAFFWTVRHPYREGQRYYSGPRVLPDSRTIALANDFFAYNSGNCYRFAAAFSWLARGLGYKTNVISGWVQAAGGGRAPHGWVEVYQGGRTYVCDPDLQHEMPGYNWYMRTYATSPTAYYNW